MIEDTILITLPENSRALVDMFISKEYKVFSLEGTKIKSKADLLRQMSQVMKFPDYFGNNWDALEECLSDLSWITAKGFVIKFVNADNFIAICPSDFRVFVQIIESVSKSWSIEETDFILIVETTNPTIIAQM